MFSKQILLIIAALVISGGLAALIISKNKEVPKQTPQEVMVTPTPTVVTMATWVDEAGFSFSYPEGITIDKHPEDTKNYANLTLNIPLLNVVNIIMADNTFKDLEGWVGTNSALDTTLDGRPAKKIIVDDVETVACIDNEVLVTISGKDITDIVNSWTFIYPSPSVSKSTQSVSGSDDGDVLEEE